VFCAGSFATATCTACKRKVGADEVRDDIMAQRIPMCRVCVPEGVADVTEDPHSYSSAYFTCDIYGRARGA